MPATTRCSHLLVAISNHSLHLATTRCSQPLVAIRATSVFLKLVYVLMTRPGKKLCTTEFLYIRAIIFPTCIIVRQTLRTQFYNNCHTTILSVFLFTSDTLLQSDCTGVCLIEFYSKSRLIKYPSIEGFDR